VDEIVLDHRLAEFLGQAHIFDLV
jgi:hypothetical protein